MNIENSSNNNYTDNHTHTHTNTNTKITENKIPYDNLCIICLDVEGYITLCINCKLKYCIGCVKKTNNKCCICFRMNNKIENPNEYYLYNNDYNNNDYNDLDDYDIQTNNNPPIFIIFFGMAMNFILGSFVFFFY